MGVVLPQPVFAHGQLYVALSRAKSFSKLRVAVYPTDEQGSVDGQTYTKNVVKPEVL